MTEIIDVMKSLQAIKNTEMKLSVQKAKLHDELKNLYKDLETKTHSVHLEDGTILKATEVENNSVQIDEKFLMDNLSEEQYRSIADIKVNRKQLEIAIKNGDIAQDLAVKAVSVKNRGSYIKFEEKRASNE